MDNKKYEFTGETKEFKGRIVHRIRALKDISETPSPYHKPPKAGELGGWIESEKNLAHTDNCWVGGNSIVCGLATVAHNAFIADNVTVFNGQNEGRIIINNNAVITGMTGGVTIDGSYIYIKDNSYIMSYLEIGDYVVIEGDVLVGSDKNVKIENCGFEGFIKPNGNKTVVSLHNENDSQKKIITRLYVH